MSMKTTMAPAVRAPLAVLVVLVIYIAPLAFGASELMEHLPKLLEGGSAREWSHSIGLSLALAALAYLLIQAVLALRLSVLDRILSHNLVMIHHRRVAVLAVILATLHPLCMFLFERVTKTGIHLADEWPLLVGAMALTTLWFTAAVALYRKFLELPFHTWWLGHRLGVSTLIVLVGVHKIFVTGEYTEAGDLAGTIAIVLFFLGVLAYNEIVKPARLSRRTYTVSEVTSPGAETHEIVLDPPSGTSLDHAPGQFAFLTFRSARLPREEHPFTIASSPQDNGRLRFTIRCSGDFTSGLGQLLPGDSCLVDGPYGLFTSKAHDPDGARPLVLIAGGVGITPMLSMLRAMHADADKAQDGRRVLCIWSNRTAGDVVHREEFAAFVRDMPHLRLVHVLTRAQKPDGEDLPGEVRYGRIDTELVSELAGPMLKKGDASAPPLAYICGPAPMMAAMRQALKDAGMAGRDIHTEEFSI